jgi:hypothetical protein
MPAPRPWLTGGQVAKRLPVSPATVARWANQSRLAWPTGALSAATAATTRPHRAAYPRPDLPALAHRPRLSHRLEGAPSCLDA